ncbi:hypothetical protein [Fulvivirga lutea]|uniref:Uncharacterized protein n=1 Tax=Fulvivirga lutea TaxID=2810512 RepID=A0A975A284_9BACT|nr:hypothetical protein [Fulvivirga lutea]QSE99171.1 hypothetical protein JR347_08810 [Fulvivirga lutea]
MKLNLLSLALISLFAISCGEEDGDLRFSCIKFNGDIKQDRINFSVVNDTEYQIDNLLFKASSGDFRPAFNGTFSDFVYVGGPDFMLTLAYIQDIIFEIDGIEYHTGSEIPMQEELTFELGNAYLIVIKGVTPETGAVETEMVFWTDGTCNDTPEG